MKRRIVFSMVCIVVAAALLWWGVRPVPNQQAEVASETIALVLDTDIGTGALQMKQGAKLAAKEQKVDLLTAAPDYAGLSDDYAQELLRIISRFPEAIVDAADKNEPSMITRAVTEVAKAYNKFFYENRILDAEPGTREARLRLTKATRDVLKLAMYLIGMEAPERM